MEMLSSDEQSSKALLPIFLTALGTTMLLSAEQFSKA
jgi:hypothetical protein